MADPTNPPDKKSTPEPTSSLRLNETGESHGADREATGVVQQRTPQATAASRAVRALTNAAAAFLLYDAGNETISALLTELRAAITGFLTAYGDLDLEVRPWDIVYRREVVYLDRDRERSLAFRLYRDGVRRIVIHPAVEWNELIALLGVLSIRFKGIQQQEDDVVTLLWKAGFKHIGVESVEGMVGEDDEADAAVAVKQGDLTGPRNVLQASVFSAAYAFDYPPPAFGERGQVAYRMIPPNMLERIAKEESPGNLARESAQIVYELLTLLHDPVDPLHADDLAPLLREIRGYLFSEDEFEGYGEVLRVLVERAPQDAETRSKLLGAFADEDAARKLFDRAATADQVTWPGIASLFGLLPCNLVPMLLAKFGETTEDAPRRLALFLLDGEARRAPQELADALLAGPEKVDRGILGILHRASPSEAARVAVSLLGTSDPARQLEALALLERAEYGPTIGRALVAALKAPTEDVRVKALSILVAKRERRAFETLLERFRAQATSVSNAEAAAIGEGLARLDPERARTALIEWVRPPGFFARLAPVPNSLRLAAITGLAALGDKESLELLRWLESRVSGELQSACAAAVARLKTAGAPR